MLDRCVEGSVVTAIASLLDRCAELKREMLKFSWQPCFDRDRSEVLEITFLIDSSATSWN